MKNIILILISSIMVAFADTGCFAYTGESFYNLAMLFITMLIISVSLFSFVFISMRGIKDH